MSASTHGGTPAYYVIDQKGETFIPHVLAVPVGTEVEFRNSGPVLHNVASGSPAKRFDRAHQFAEGEVAGVQESAEKHVGIESQWIEFFIGRQFGRR